jgi:fructokinase
MMFVVCGEALFDLFLTGEDATGLDMRAVPGGSPFNLAIGLARLGQDVAFLAGISKDFLGERLVAVLARESVDLSLLVRNNASTTLSLVGQDSQGRPAYAFLGENAADRALSAADLPPLPSTARALAIGSFALVVEPVGSFIRALVMRESGRRLVACDLNVRPTIEPDPARWRDRLSDMLPHLHLLKMSDEDLGWLYPGADEAALVAGWLTKGAASTGPSLVAITRGGHGASLFTAKQRVDVPAVPVMLVDTVGAGDTFQAAMLAGLARRDALTPQALAALSAGDLAAIGGLAVAAAAITCGRRGADLPRATDLGPY